MHSVYRMKIGGKFFSYGRFYLFGIAFFNDLSSLVGDFIQAHSTISSDNQDFFPSMSHLGCPKTRRREVHLSVLDKS